MAIDFSEVGSDENWELFARDLLSDLGFVIEVEPGRGADQGKDLVVSEQLRGNIATKKFVWLVSCKYFTKSDRSVGFDKEINIIERLDQHKCDGFMGFYSTIASSSLIDRLRDLSDSKKISQYELFDRQKISAHFYNYGRSKLALRYFPKTYHAMRPIQNLFSEYIPLNCEICGRDVLLESITKSQSSIILFAAKFGNYLERDKIYVVHKGNCDITLSERLKYQGFHTSWEDIGDLCNPILYIKSMMSYMNVLHEKRYSYSKEAHEKLKTIYLAISQRTLREINKEDEKRYKTLRDYSS